MTEPQRRLELVGDMAIKLLLTLVMHEEHPLETVQGIASRLHYYLRNTVFNDFCELKQYPYGSKGFERQIASLIQQDFNMAKKLVREYYLFSFSEEREKAFKDHMVRLTHNKCSCKPKPCPDCGSGNLRVWRHNPRIVCQDCGYFFKTQGQTAVEQIEDYNHHAMALEVS